MDKLYNYGNLIIISVILITITEILLPEGAMKKYTLLLTSLMISFTIASPLIRILNDDFDFSEVFNLEFDGFSNDISFENNVYNVQVENLEMTFESKLIEELKSEFANEGYEINSADVIFSTDSEGKIQDILSATFNVVGGENINIDEVKRRISKVAEIEEKKITVMIL